MVRVVIRRHDHAKGRVQLEPAGELPQHASFARDGLTDAGVEERRILPETAPRSHAALEALAHVVLAKGAAKHVHVDGQPVGVRRDFARSAPGPHVERGRERQSRDAKLLENAPGPRERARQDAVHHRAPAPARHQRDRADRSGDLDGRAHPAGHRSPRVGDAAAVQLTQAGLVGLAFRRRVHSGDGVDDLRGDGAMIGAGHPRRPRRTGASSQVAGEQRHPRARRRPPPAYRRPVTPSMRPREHHPPWAQRALFMASNSFRNDSIECLPK